MLKITTIIPLLTVLTSCAPIITTLPNQKVSQPAPIKTPSEQINDFQIKSEKEQISQIIAQEYEEPNEFLKDVNNKKVQFWVNYFGHKNKDRFERFLNNGEKFKKIIEEVFEDHGLPKELYYVGLIESGYYLKARSHANAVGPWQFIKSTAKRYGLQVNSKVDERRNIHKSTKAAALFFQDLYNIFGSWELALSAYNAGEYGIIRRIRNANTRDYYQLSENKDLPAETINYVPKVLAAIQIASDPKKYHIKVNKNQSNLYNNTKMISLKGSYHLQDIAKASKLELEVLKKLNPDISKMVTPVYRQQDHKLIVPSNTKVLVSKIKPHRNRKIATNSSLEYKVKKGDSLYDIAKKFKSSINDLIEINNLKSKRIYIGQSLKVKSENHQYVVKKGDYLGKVARLNHTTVSNIMKLNNLKKKTIYRGQKLYVPNTDKTIYTVKHGDYLGKIADRFGVSISKIKKLNSMRRSKIYPGQRLIVSLN